MPTRLISVILLIKCIHQTIDDCWSAEHFKCLDVVDTSSTSSKVLVSSRISGLLPGSTEVRLSLFSVSESVEVRHVLFGFMISCDLCDSCLLTPRGSIQSLCLRRLSRLQIWLVDCLSRCTVSVLNANDVQN